MSYQLTIRDKEILDFINEFGYCHLKQIMQRFNINQSNGYKIMNRLCTKKLVIHDRIYLRKPGVYRLSVEGADYTDLPTLKRLPNFQYEHQLRVVDVYLQLRKQNPEADWIAERYLLKDRSYKDIKNKKHIPDGMLVLPNQQIAIEVELSLKEENRLSNILKWYAGQFSIHEVWYFCLPHIIPKLTKLSIDRSFIKIHNLKEFLA